MLALKFGTRCQCFGFHAHDFSTERDVMLSAMVAKEEYDPRHRRSFHREAEYMAKRCGLLTLL